MENDILSARDWLIKVEEDIAVAEHLLKTSKFYAGICFHCEQAAEKALKAFLVYHREVPKKIHLLKELLKDCLKYDDSLKEFIPDLEILDKLYIPTRYPFKLNFTKEKSEDSIKAAKIVIVKIREKIK